MTILCRRGLMMLARTYRGTDADEYAYSSQWLFA